MNRIEEYLICFLLFIKEKAVQTLNKVSAISPYIAFMKKKGAMIKETKPRDVLDFVLKLIYGIVDIPLGMIEKTTFWFVLFLGYLLVVFATAVYRLLTFGWADAAGPILLGLSACVFIFLAWLFAQETGEFKGGIKRALGIAVLMILIVSLGAQAATDAGIEPVSVQIVPLPTAEQAAINVYAHGSGGVMYLDFVNNASENLTFYGTISVDGVPGASSYLDTQQLPMGSVRQIEMIVNRPDYLLRFSGYGCCVIGNDFRIEFSQNVTNRSHMNIISNKLYHPRVEVSNVTIGDAKKTPGLGSPLSAGILLIAVLMLRRKKI